MRRACLFFIAHHCRLPARRQHRSLPLNRVSYRRAVQMESVTVTTVAGNDLRQFVDGIGTAATFFYPDDVCYSEASGSLLIADCDSDRIRCFFPATDKRKSLLRRALTSALVESDALSVHALIL